MSDNILHRYTGRAAPSSHDVADTSDSDGTEEFFGTFGWVRGVRDVCRMLELRKRTGDVMAIPYAYISAISFDPSSGITIKCGDLSIRIKGVNLNAEARPQVRMLQGLTRHKVSFIQEAERAGSVQPQLNAVQVNSIEW